MATELDDLQQQLQEITTKIDKIEEVLKQAQSMSGRYTRKSDIGWLLSMFSGEAGTLLAVLSGMKARKWDDIDF